MHIKLHIVHTYRILATQIISMFYHTYILLYYQNLKCTLTIILLLVKISKIILDFVLLDYHPPKVCCGHCDKTVPHLTINTTSSNKITPQADQEPGQYRSDHDWYSKLIRLEHEHRLLKFWIESCALHYGDLLASKK